MSESINGPKCLVFFFLTTTSWFDLFSDAGPLSLQYILVFVTASIFPVCILMIIFYNSCYYIRDRDNKRHRGTKKKNVAIISIDNWAEVFSFFFYVFFFVQCKRYDWIVTTFLRIRIFPQSIWNVKFTLLSIINGDESWIYV